jgi:hypothetical protein|nr:MAG TPA: restriction endonuclease [Caudoviricetes sp.]
MKEDLYQNNRDERGRFIKGIPSDLPVDIRAKIIQKAIETKKKNPNYIGDLKEKYPYIFNSWRGMNYTQKGKNIGVCERWKSFKLFLEDSLPQYKDGYVFRRKDVHKPFCPENTCWVSKEEYDHFNNKTNSIKIEYKGKCLSLKEWAELNDRSLNAIKNLYFKKYLKGECSIEKVLFGDLKELRIDKSPKDYKTVINPRTKASKMIREYKVKDKQIGFTGKECDLTPDYILKNIFGQKCIYCGTIKNVGCDRIDNSKPHTIDNIVPACAECNFIRGNRFNVEEMKLLGKTIQLIRQNRNKSS